MKIIIAPLDELVEHLRPRLSQAVEPLQVAAALESEGLNDKVARERYGHPDVFALAEAVYARLSRDEPEPAAPAFPVAAWRSLVHGPLYAMPAALLPAVSALVGVRWLMPGLVVTTGIGWVLGSVLSRMAYGLTGRGSPGSAARTLRWGLAAGVVLAGGTATLWDGPAAIVLVAVAQLTFQIGSGILLFHRREGLLAVLMLPATGAGVLYVAVGHPPVALMAVALGAVSIGAVACAAVLLTRPSRADGRPRLDGELGVAALYSGLTAAFLLQAEAAYVVARPDLAITGAGLVLGMGVLEWRAHRFEWAVRRVIRQVCYPAEFTAQGHRLLARGLGGCLAALAVLTAVPVAFTQVSPPVVVMAAAHVLLGGAYFVAFLLANQGRLTELCLAQGAALLLHPGLGLLLPGNVLADVLLFLAACLLFLSALLALMSRGLGDVWHYR